MRTIPTTGTARLAPLAVSIALALSLGACTESGDDDSAAPVAAPTVPVAGAPAGADNPMAPVPDDGTGGFPATGAPTQAPTQAPAGGGLGAPTGTTVPTAGGDAPGGIGFPAPGGGLGSDPADDGVPGGFGDDDGSGDDGLGGTPGGGLGTGTGGLGGGGLGGGTEGGGAGGAPGGSVSAALVNRFTSNDDFEFWSCDSENDELDGVGYLFGNGQGRWFGFLPDGTNQELDFTWQANAADSVLLNFPNGDEAEDITTIEFEGTQAWYGYSSYFGELDCSLASNRG